MGAGYRVQGAVGPALPGIVAPADLDGTIEWIPVGRTRTLLDEIAARLGSEVDPRKVVLAVFTPLRAALDGPPLAALLAHLPPPLARELAAGGAAVGGGVRSPRGSGDHLLEVSRLILQPPWRAATYVRAAFAAARAMLAPDEQRQIAARLPSDLAEPWLSAS